ncbi:MAG: dodecin [Nitriliruptoraceae bacterium]
MMDQEGDVSSVYKKIELVGSSREGVDDAIQRAVAKASETMRNLDWFEVTEIRGWIQDGSVQHTQVTLQVGFRLDD